MSEKYAAVAPVLDERSRSSCQCQPLDLVVAINALRWIREGAPANPSASKFLRIMRCDARRRSGGRASTRPETDNVPSNNETNNRS